MKGKYEDYSKEVLFTVGQRVHVELPEVPKEQRDITTGIIIRINTHFHATPEHRSIWYTVRFDNKGNYVKKKFQSFASSIEFEFVCEARRLVAI